MRKILYSPGYGAGWVSWASGTQEQLLFMLEHPGLISAVESKENTSEKSPAMARFVADWAERFPGEDPPYLGGGVQLAVAEVHGRVKISEYDGFESYEEEGSEEGWL